MNDKFSNDLTPEEEAIARKLSQAAGQTRASERFAAELESKLRSTHHPRTGWFCMRPPKIAPVLGWVVLMVVLALVLSWSIKTLIPAPQPAINPTAGIPAVPTSTPEPNLTPELSASPATQEGGYDFRGGKLFLQQPLPEAPGKAHVYLLSKDAPAAREQAQVLAEHFGIQGEMYTTKDYVFNTDDYVISDGKQMLQVYSGRYFSYTADMAKNLHNGNGTPNENAEAVIHAFLQARGMDFPFDIQASDYFGGYSIRPLAPDSIPMQYESFTWPPMRVTLDENGNVLNIDATLLALDQTPVGEYDILSAQEAFDILRDDSVMGGKTEFMHSSNPGPQEWYRTYPDYQTITISGYLFRKPALDPGKPDLLLIDNIPVIGNTVGLESLEDYLFLKATGQYIVENGVRKFKVEAWDRKVNEAYLSGKLSRQGDQMILTSDDGSGRQYPLIDPPADLPLDAQTLDSYFAVSGLILDNAFSWSTIQLFENNMGGGGGGGGGLGFYKLNLSGTPVAFPPTRVPQPVQSVPTGMFTDMYTIKEGDTLTAIAQTYNTTVDELMRLNGLTDANIYIGQTLFVPVPEIPEKRVEDLRGYLNISIHEKGDGTSTWEYRLEVSMPEGGSTVYTLEGANLGELDAYNALPILVSGTLKGNLFVESYKIPYPDLHFQILRGTQKLEGVGGQNVVTFTTEDGTSYVEYMATNNFPKSQEMTGYQGDLIEQEVLIIPDEFFGGLPVAHVYQSSLIQQNGPAMQVQANIIHTYNDSSAPGGMPENTPPNLIIDRVELVDYVPNPYYQAASDPNYSLRSPYIQPAWHFQGHYDGGGEVDFLIQALRQEFLLPEISPGLSPG